MMMGFLFMKFTTVKILNITSGVLCSNMDDIYEVLQYMTQNQLLHTMQLPEAADKCKPVILEKYPCFISFSKNIKGMEYKDLKENFSKLMSEFETINGSEFELPQLPPANYDEGVETFMRNGGKVIQVDPTAPQAVEKLLLEINYLSDD